jgi:hypothetical protein
VRGPLACIGGADAETADDIKATGPASALTLGRAVSLLDFEAMAQRYTGVVNADRRLGMGRAPPACSGQALDPRRRG